MVTLQEYLNCKYTTDESKLHVEEIDIYEIHYERRNLDTTELLDGGLLDLRSYVNLKKLNISGHDIGIKQHRDSGIYFSTPILKLDLSTCICIEYLDASYQALTDVDFLMHLPKPEKLKILKIYDNNIQTTNIEVFSKFINLSSLFIGTSNIRENSLVKGKLNRFYGSLKSLNALNTLKLLYFDSTDIDSGLEFLPKSLLTEYEERLKVKLSRYLDSELTLKTIIEAQDNVGSNIIRCASERNNAKCLKLHNQLNFFRNNLKFMWLLFPLQRIIGECFDSSLSNYDSEIDIYDVEKKAEIIISKIRNKMDSFKFSLEAEQESFQEFQKMTEDRNRMLKNCMLNSIKVVLEDDNTSKSEVLNHVVGLIKSINKST
ncbi:MAG TPA: hypothetical protein VJ697_13845 [Nitrososphaeraceae archaeon]|nr:hypothetical protein [Nitrososphaeraceae archaeon]